MNYTELYDAICKYAENYEPDFLASIPTFVEQTEQRVFNEVQLPAIRKSVNVTLTSGNQYATLPTDFLATFSIAVISGGDQYFLVNKDVNFIREAYPSVTSQSIPMYYAQFDAETLIFGPTPNSNYSTELHYYAYPESIVTAGTSWLGDNFDSVLLYGALLEAGVFTRQEKDIMEYYKIQYDTALASLKELGDGKNRRDAYRSGQYRAPVN